jgi:hypothetical protein
MLSSKLVHLIESHWDQIMARAIDQVRREPDMVHIRDHFKADAPEWAEDLLQHLGHWLLAGNNLELARKYEVLGLVRFDEDVPLHESVRSLFILREKMLDYVEEHLLDKNTVSLYAEEEFDRQLVRFFDLLTVHMVRGYEKALRSDMTVR